MSDQVSWIKISIIRLCASKLTTNHTEISRIKLFIVNLAMVILASFPYANRTEDRWLPDRLDLPVNLELIGCKLKCKCLFTQATVTLPVVTMNKLKCCRCSTHPLGRNRSETIPLPYRNPTAAEMKPVFIHVHFTYSQSIWFSAVWITTHIVYLLPS